MTRDKIIEAIYRRIGDDMEQTKDESDTEWFFAHGYNMAKRNFRLEIPNLADEVIGIVFEQIEKTCGRHISWKSTEGHSSEEELGFQKGLVAGAKLLSHDIINSLTQDITNKEVE